VENVKLYSIVLLLSYMKLYEFEWFTIQYNIAVGGVVSERETSNPNLGKLGQIRNYSGTLLDISDRMYQ